MNPLEAGNEIELNVEKPVAGGRMLARVDGRVVFVAGAIPGERVRARVERVARQLAFAEVTEILEGSPDRRPSRVDWACGGCLYAHIGYERQLSLKSELVADTFQRIAKIGLPAPVSVTESTEDGYRTRARFHARDGRFGFFREGSHQLCDAASTGQLLASTTHAVANLQETLRRAKVEGVAACEISENIEASERVALVELQVPLPDALRVDHVEGLTGLVFADHAGSRDRIAFGSPYISDRVDVGGVAIALTHHVRSFFQGNRYLTGPLASTVLARVPAGGVVDLYAGVGLFAVSMAAAGRKGIVAVEGDPSGASDLDGNAARFSGSIAVAHLSVERYLERREARRSQTAIVDPPRTGLSRDAMKGLMRAKPSCLVYVSCDLATLAHDVKACTEQGYGLTHIEAFDMFPNTGHVETVAVLEREN